MIKRMIRGIAGGSRRRGHLVVAFYLFIAAWSVFFAGTCGADTQVVGEVTFLEGSVDILAGGKLPARPAKMGDAVASSDFVRTKSNSKAEITFRDGNVLRMAQRTRIDISEYKLGVKGSIKLPRGKVEASVQGKALEGISTSPGAARFEIHTPNAVAGVRGTRFFVYFDKNITGVVVKQGEVFVFNLEKPGSAVTVTKGMATRVHQGRPPLPPQPASRAAIEKLERDVAPSPKMPGKQGEKKSAENDLSPAGDSAQTEGGTPDSSVSGTAPVDAVTTGQPIAAMTGGDVQTTQAGETLSSGETSGLSISGDSAPVDAVIAENSVAAADVSLEQGTQVEGQAPAGGDVSLDASSTPLTDTVLVPIVADTAPPVISLLTSPPVLSNLAGASFEMDTNEEVTYSYSLDNGEWVAASSGEINLSGLSEGAHTISITATDSSGNSSALTYTWTTDFTAPSMSIKVANAGPSGKPSLVLILRSNEESSYSYRVDGGAWTDTSGVIDISAFGDGTHTLEYSAEDPAGNMVVLSVGVTTSGSFITGSGGNYITGGSISPTALSLGSYTESRIMIGRGPRKWQGFVKSLYGGSPSPNDWNFSLEYNEDNFRSIAGQEITGGQWADGVLSGKAVGYWADITGAPSTGIYVGEVSGTFNPADYTWEAAISGAWIRTQGLLAGACPAGRCSTTGTNLTESQKKLQELNIPIVEVGRTDLSGSLIVGPKSAYDFISVTLDDVVFFSSQSGGKPAIWATDSITGSYSFSSYLNASNIVNSVNSIPLSNGAGLSAELQIRQWSMGDSKWTASIKDGSGTLGGGSYTGSVSFSGAAAGIFSSTVSGSATTGSLGGTAAGTVR